MSYNDAIARCLAIIQPVQTAHLDNTEVNSGWEGNRFFRDICESTADREAGKNLIAHAETPLHP